MSRTLTFALALCSVTAPLYAQRGGGGHAGTSHGTGSPHAGLTSGSFHYTGGPLSGTRTFSPIGSQHLSSGFSASHIRTFGNNRREGYRSNRGGAFYPGALGLGYGIYPSAGYDDGAYLPDSGQPQPDAQQQPEAPQPPAEISRPTYRLAPPPAPEEAITLIFKDGRPAQQIHNYLATRTTITAIDGPHHRDIPVADLDIPATTQANGGDFHLPGPTN